MRADMGKVLVERPRLGSRNGSRPKKGYRKRLQQAIDSGEPLPAREGMKVRCGRGRHFNEHLGPLRRFLNSSVGRPWDKIYSEICAHVDRDNVVQKHILTHLFQYVIRDVILIDGQPCIGEPGYWYGTPLRESNRKDQWYVCPKSGLLRRTRHVPRSSRKKSPTPQRRVKLNNTQLCLELNGQWELVTVASLPVPGYGSSRYDVVRKRTVHSSPDPVAQDLYGAEVYATARRPLAKTELRSLPVPIDWLK